MAKVLIIDDSEGVRDSLRRTLERSGHEVATAEDGKEAMKHIKESVPDVVITDVFMPEMDGFEVILAIRQRFSQLPIIVMTGSPDPVYRKAGVQLGAVLSLSKPFKAEELLASIDHALVFQAVQP